ncbi:hypothetical protein B0J12DRAFT_257137 [Macrophomina phaseolina]|uniref:Uncharacterized protein n=1 Tax=Macrophomina phaseolina TaxID=35725 RepID=A0ABQ8FZF4_9PEZI|nr:hypothetical protein B0J12DRAFT_257137 [Macrophomina phaseolina]
MWLRRASWPLMQPAVPGATSLRRSAAPWSGVKRVGTAGEQESLLTAGCGEQSRNRTRLDGGGEREEHGLTAWRAERIRQEGADDRCRVFLVLLIQSIPAGAMLCNRCLMCVARSGHPDRVAMTHGDRRHTPCRVPTNTTATRRGNTAKLRALQQQPYPYPPFGRAAEAAAAPCSTAR